MTTLLASTARPFSLRNRVVAMAAVVAIAVTACASDDDSADTTTVSATDPTTTVEEAPTTTESSTTTIETTTSTAPETTTTSTTTVPETTTTVRNESFDPSTVAEQVERAVLDNATAYRDCITDLPACDVDEATKLSVGAYRQGFVDQLLEWQDAGAQVRNVDSYQFRVLDVTQVEPVDPVAIAAYCVVDQTVIFIPAADGNDEEILDDSVVASKRRLQVIFAEGAWKVSASETLETLETPDIEACS